MFGSGGTLIKSLLYSLLNSTCRGVMQDRTVTLYIPGLFTPVKSVSGLSNELLLDGLALLLSRARRRSNAFYSFDGGMFSLFGESAVKDAFPVASITRLIDCPDRDDSSYWLRADPVHMQPDRDQIVMFGNAKLDIRTDEVVQLVSEFNSLFAEDGIYLQAPVSQRWYLKCDSAPRICTTPLEQVIGKNIDTYLPKGSDALYWHRFLSEVQMLFYNSSVNRARREEGKPEINSVWFWGGGCLPLPQETLWKTVCGNNVVGRGLATLYGIDQFSLPESAEEWLEFVDNGNHLVVFDGAHSSLAEKDIFAWKSFMDALDSDWIGSLISALKAGKLAQVNLVTDGATFELTARNLKRWWKRRKPFVSHI